VTKKNHVGLADLPVGGLVRPTAFSAINNVIHKRRSVKLPDGSMVSFLARILYVVRCC
jgi:hypothetical protein